MITFNFSTSPLFLATVLGVPAVSVMATAILLTSDREPAPMSVQSAPGPNGCVMFCEDTPKPSFNEGNCAEPPPGINIRLWHCDPIRTPQPKTKPKTVSRAGCVMFCDEREWGERR
ncbi:hypothetical protein [Nocardia brasiliensis]|uniref:hypothetical protein n=1 Tax=Nocardia brasiliensis TaxID=37326 RepID=UPI002453A582|nr:hypothetical protein [Nocardia brasiliensis]